jgi:2'-5' RNA ligase
VLERCIMVFPKFDSISIIDDIRRKYDPLAYHVSPHITLVFPFESNIESTELEDHLKKALSSIKPFRIILKGITPDKEPFGNYLFLNIEKGKDEIIELHRRLYTGLLEPFISQRLKSGGYKPHMTVGKIDCEDKFKLAIEETKDIGDAFDTIVSKVSVEIIDENEDSIIEMEIDLGGARYDKEGCC